MIGVFDSGHGGLTVLEALIARLPERSFLYLGDHGHAPYGERGVEEIHDLTLANVERLFHEGCRLVLLACNTAAAVALRRLRTEQQPPAAAARIGQRLDDRVSPVEPDRGLAGGVPGPPLGGLFGWSAGPGPAAATWGLALIHEDGYYVN